MTKAKAKADERYLVTRPQGITTGSGHYAQGAYVPVADLAGALRRMLHRGFIVDLAPGTAADQPVEAEGAEDGGGKVAAAVARADLPTLAHDSDAAGVVEQSVPVVLRFLSAHPDRAGDVHAAERRGKNRKTILDAAKGKK